MSKNSFLSFLQNRPGIIIFLIGKILRFGFFLGFIIILLGETKTLVGYNLNQTIFFYLTFNLLDVSGQFLFREVYRFRSQVVDGSFDLTLTKPWNSLFRSLMGGADILDFLTIPPLIIGLLFVGSTLSPSYAQIILYIALLINSFVLITAFHIAILSLAVVTLEIDHTVMIYRDISNLGRLPVDIYKEPLRGLVTFFIPIGVMMSFPAKGLMGMLSVHLVFISFALGVVMVFSALRLWRFALKRYASASS